MLNEQLNERKLEIYNRKARLFPGYSSVLFCSISSLFSIITLTL